MRRKGPVAQTYIIECDGCQTNASDGYHRIRIEVTAMRDIRGHADGSDRINDQYELCPDCVTRLLAPFREMPTHEEREKRLDERAAAAMKATPARPRSPR